jgi:hypothetical protein
MNTQGIYEQPKDVLEIFKFYLKGQDFYSLPTKMQKYFLDILTMNFKENGRYAVIHYNKIYTLQMGNVLFQHLARLNQTNTSLFNTHEQRRSYASVAQPSLKIIPSVSRLAFNSKAEKFYVGSSSLLDNTQRTSHCKTTFFYRHAPSLLDKDAPKTVIISKIIKNP